MRGKAGLGNEAMYVGTVNMYVCAAQHYNMSWGPAANNAARVSSRAYGSNSLQSPSVALVACSLRAVHTASASMAAPSARARRHD